MLRTCAALLLLLVATDAGAGERISPTGFRYISERTPSVFDNFYDFSRIYEARRPRLLIYVEPLFGPLVRIPTDKGELDASLSYVKLTFGSVLYAWDEGGVSLRFDWRSLGLGAYKGSYFPSKTVGWSYYQGLGTLSGFHGQWRGTAGIFFEGKPSVIESGGQLQFTADLSQATDGDHVTASVKSGAGAFFDLSSPYLDLALIIDADGLDRLKAAGRLRRFEIVDSFGPYFLTFPKVDNYQLGLYGDELQILGRYLTASAETALRYEKGEGVAFNHVVLKVSTTLFVDDPKRETNFRRFRWSLDNLLGNLDFHLRIEVHGSYFNSPGSKSKFGGGGLVELLSFGVLGIEGNFAVAVNWNYYEDVIELPVTDVLTGRIRIVLGF